MHSTQLLAKMLSPSVQVQVPSEGQEEKAKLTAQQLVKVFTDHVPGVQNFLFRQQPGQHVLKFMQMAYHDGLRAFKGTALEDHLKWLFRLVVHHGYEGKPGAASFLREVAEAFMDCQAVQARVIEHVGLQIRGVTANFQGLVTALVGEYKSMALKMLAYERISQGKAHDDATPTHYENRLTDDLGDLVGLNADDVRRAALDEHAQARFPKLRAKDAEAAAARCRELFDMDAFVQALISELNSFSAQSSSNSLPLLFLDWASENMKEKHMVFDEETCMHMEVNRSLATAILEVLFLGQVVSTADDMHRGMQLRDIFHQTAQPSEDAKYGSDEREPAVNIMSNVPKPPRRRRGATSKTNSTAKRNELDVLTNNVAKVSKRQRALKKRSPSVHSNESETKRKHFWDNCICPATNQQEFDHQAPENLSNYIDVMFADMV